ncbi:MAG TPA: hypothetical protein PKN48_04260 [Bacteroidales bacterium]|nr:hypothetical protein [Bacteroidales bacterium]
MKRLFIFILFLAVFNYVDAQLTGTKNIPGDYTTIAAAVNDLNILGVGAGGVIFNIAAGYTETAANIVITTPTASALNPVIFQKAGSGPNPLITAGTGTGTVDGIIEIQGTDYITIDGIDVSENPANNTSTTLMEWGFGIFSSSATDGSKQITIRNCNISLSTSNTTGSKSNGIFIKYQTASSSTAITPTSVNGIISDIFIYSNSINNVVNGIYLYGNTSQQYYINNIEIGVAGGNNITASCTSNSSFSSYGLYFTYANNLKIGNNIVNASSKYSIYGICTATGVNSRCEIFNNQVTITGNGTTSHIYAISNSMGGSGVNNRIKINNNIVENCMYPTATTGRFYCIYQDADAYNCHINDNIVRNNQNSGNGNFLGIYQYGSIKNNDSIYNNQIYGNICTGKPGNFDCLSDWPTITTHKYIFGNEIYNNLTYGYSIFGLYSLYGIDSYIHNNKIYGQVKKYKTGTNIGLFIQYSKANIYNNYIYDLRGDSSNSDNSIRGIHIGSECPSTKVYFNTIRLNASSSADGFGTSGIYAYTDAVVELKNNIIVNNSTAGYGGKTVAYRRSNATLTTYSSKSDNNLFYAGIPGATNVIYSDGTNTDITLDAFQIRVSPTDDASFTEMPPFVNISSAPYNLHLMSTVNTGCESGGDSLTDPSVFKDVDSDIRWGEADYYGTGSAPDVGADEFNGIPSFNCVAPNPGKTLSTSNEIYLGDTIILFLQNTVPVTGVSYQWQSSVNGTVYYNINGATDVSYTTVPDTTTYYRCNVTCKNGPTSGLSIPVHIMVAKIITSTTPAIRCGNGSVTLAATAVPGSTLYWYNANADSLLGTGSPWTTPVIDTTTIFNITAIKPESGFVLGAGSHVSDISQSPFFFDGFGCNKSQYLILASELSAIGMTAGNINKLALDVVSPGTTFHSFNLSIGSTTSSQFGLQLFTGLTSVFSAASIKPSAGLNTFDFSSPFFWNGTSNIIIEFCWSNNYCGGQSATVRYDNCYSGSNYKLQYNAPSVSFCNTIDYTAGSGSRPQLFFNYSPAGSCSGIPVMAVVTPAPIVTVNVTPDTICIGETSILDASSSNTSYTYLWSPVTYPPVGSSVVVSPASTTVYTLTAVDNSGGSYNGCVVTDTITVYIGGGHAISGTTRYVGKANSGYPAPNLPTYEPSTYKIDNVIVLLKSYPSGTELARDTSNALGAYQFSNVSDGDYILAYDHIPYPDTMQYVNHVNAVDLALLKYSIGHDPVIDPSRYFSDKHRMGANVDNNASLNTIDVARITAKVGSPYDPAKNYPKGNWVAFDTLVAVAGADLNVTLQTIAYGDYDASSVKYLGASSNWSMAKVLSDENIILLSDESITMSDSEYFEVPLRISTKMNELAAVGLELSYPNEQYKLVSAYMSNTGKKDGPIKINSTLEKIIAANNDLHVTDDQGIIRVVYATTKHFDISENDVIITLVFKPLKELQPGLLDFSLTGTGIIGDQFGNEQSDAFLLMPNLFFQGMTESDPSCEFSAYPNPISDNTTIYYNLPETGNVNIKVFNALGELVSVLLNEMQISGRHTLVFSGMTLPVGMYTFKLEFESSQKSEHALLKMIKY